MRAAWLAGAAGAALVLAGLMVRPAAAGCRARCASNADRTACVTRCRALPACARDSEIGTLAYVVTECRAEPGGLLSGAQRLVIQRGACPPLTVLELTSDPVVDVIGLCDFLAESRLGTGSILTGSFHRLAVTPGGEAVVFELTGDRSVVPTLPNVRSAPEAGFYHVRADGTGLRRLAPASHAPDFAEYPDLTSRVGRAFNLFVDLHVSPDGRTVAFTDEGPGPDGAQALQVVTLDLATGRRTQVTDLTAPAIVPEGHLATRAGGFVDDQTLTFGTFAAGGPGEAFFTVDLGGGPPRRLQDPIAGPSAKLVPSFEVTGNRARLLTFELPVAAENPLEGAPDTREVFLFDGKNLLQLSTFNRADTVEQTLLGRRAIFSASADPFGDNPGNACQLFSVGHHGGRLRQLTSFRGAGRPNCGFGTPECYIAPVFPDPATRTLVFMSSCPQDRPYGAQLFAMRADGSRLRQLTALGGTTFEANGSEHVELPGPIAYASAGRR